MKTRFWANILICLLLCVFCSCEKNDDDDHSDDDADDDTADFQIEWTQCPDYITGYLLEGQEAACAHIPLPLDYEDENSENIPIFIFKVSTPAATKSAHVWLLEGGPGGAGEDWAPFMPYINKDHPEIDVYSLDHRGVGNSAKLSCSQEYGWPFDFAGCIEELESTWGDNLLKFTTTNAARDLGNVIEIASKNAPEVFVMGVSYGTYWAHRYMQLYPDQATGVILDSICPPGRCLLDTYDQNFNDVGAGLMAVCAEDATCAEKLGTIDADPWNAVGKIFELIDEADGCPALFGIDRPTARNILAYMEMDATVRLFIPAVVYRLYRCNVDDQIALNNLFEILFSASKGLDAGDYLPDFDQLDASNTLGTLVLLSELWNDTPSEDLREFDESAYFSLDLGTYIGEIAESGLWPRYGDDGYIGEWALTDLPILMMNGNLDPQTTIQMAQPAGEHFQGAFQNFVTMPQTPHCVICQALTEESIGLIMEQKAEYITKTCGMDILYGFLADPQAAPDTSCIEQLHAIEFSADSDFNRYMSLQIFGTEDMWEGTPEKKRDAPIGRFDFHFPRRGPISFAPRFH